MPSLKCSFLLIQVWLVQLEWMGCQATLVLQVKLAFQVVPEVPDHWDQRVTPDRVDPEVTQVSHEFYSCP